VFMNKMLICARGEGTHVQEKDKREKENDLTTNIFFYLDELPNFSKFRSRCGALEA